MKLSSSLLLYQLASLSYKCAGEDCALPGELVCMPATTAPTLDADLTEWEGVDGISTPLSMIGGSPTLDGEATLKCMHDGTSIYFAFEFPGAYRFNSTENRHCAAIATMFKVGAEATFVGMGGCPDELYDVCDQSVQEVCADHLVDIGAHWELKGTEQGVEYPVNPDTGSGNDLIANNDDEYAVNSFCRFDDDGADAGNEWAGAWAHTNSTMIGAEGTYIFEISRLLKTPSNVTDIQLSQGDTYSFGVAYWDPFEDEVTGWSAAGHYITGCATSWIDLVLSDGSMTSDAEVQSGAAGSSPNHASILSTIVPGLLLPLTIAVLV